MNDHARKYGIAAAILAVAAAIILFGLFHASSGSGNRMRAGSGLQYFPCQQVAFPCQQVAFQSNSLTLDIGVKLAGKGEVVEVLPGSPAERTGIVPGDVINRINGR